MIINLKMHKKMHVFIPFCGVIYKIWIRKKHIFPKNIMHGLIFPVSSRYLWSHWIICLGSNEAKNSNKNILNKIEKKIDAPNLFSAVKQIPLCFGVAGHMTFKLISSIIFHFSASETLPVTVGQSAARTQLECSRHVPQLPSALPTSVGALCLSFMGLNF